MYQTSSPPPPQLMMFWPYPCVPLLDAEVRKIVPSSFLVGEEKCQPQNNAGTTLEFLDVFVGGEKLHGTDGMRSPMRMCMGAAEEGVAKIKMGSQNLRAEAREEKQNKSSGVA